MAHPKFTSVYEMLKDNNFNIENAISSDIFCAICNKILINAHNAPCGCRYCLECITAYLDGEDKCCPGNTDDCKIELLNINNNIYIDHPMNIKISRLMVKCPEGQCNERVELKRLDDHIRVCNLRPIDCPFFNVGCRNVQMSIDKMEQHILSENHEHTKLLMDCIDSLRGEVGQMKEEMREDGGVVRDDMRDMREELREMKTKMKEMKAEVNEMRELKAEMREMREEVKGKQIVIDESRAVIAQKSLDMTLLREEIVALGNVNRQMKDQINGLDSKIESYEAVNFEKLLSEMKTQMNDKYEQMDREGKAIKIDHDKMSTRIDEISQQTAAMMAKSEKECRAIGDVDVKIGGLEERMIAMAAQQNQLNYGEFVWTIDNFADKRQKAQNGIKTIIYSEAFFSHKNRYKMCLSVFPDGDGVGKGTHLSVYYYLMRGPFDNILQWPFKYDVTIAIINQQTGLNHISDIVKYDDSQNCDCWKKPITDTNNIGYGKPQFIKLGQLMNDISLYRNDRIFIKCTVQIS